MRERRRQTRKPVRFLVQHQSDKDAGYELDYVTDLSAGGLFIASRATPAPASTVHVRFAPLKDSALVSTFARVTHVTPTGFGAEFIGLDEDAEKLLRSLA